MHDPAFLFYPSDFLTGVSDLTFEERGQYITLLCLQHQKGRLTQKAIALCCGNATADVLQKFDVDEEGLYFNKRLEAEIEKRAQFSEKQRERAVKGWEKRKDGLSHGNATAMPLVNRDININTNTLNTKNKKTDGGGRARSDKPKKVSFQESDIFDPLKFKEYFSDWDKGKLRYYYDSAVSYSAEGNTYADWGLALKKWAKKDELEGKIKFKSETSSILSKEEEREKRRREGELHMKSRGLN